MGSGTDKMLQNADAVSGNKRRDLAHVLDFVSQLKRLEVAGGAENVGTSNIAPNALIFDLGPFRALQCLEVRICLLVY